MKLIAYTVLIAPTFAVKQGHRCTYGVADWTDEFFEFPVDAEECEFQCAYTIESLISNSYTKDFCCDWVPDNEFGT